MSGVRVLQGALSLQSNQKNALPGSLAIVGVSGRAFFPGRASSPSPSPSPTAVSLKGNAIVSKKTEAAREAQQGFDLVKFLQSTKEEFSKVVWPSRQQVVSESAAVLLMVTLVALVIYFVDNLFGWIAQQVFG